MSSAVISTSAALSRPFIFDAEPAPEVYSPFADSKKPARQAQEAVVANVLQSRIGSRPLAIPLAPASHLAIRPAPEMASSGIAALDSLTGGLPRGCLTEICGSASSGRTSVMLAALVSATSRGEYCAIIDASDALDPRSVAAAGIELDRLLWVRCGEDSPRKRNSPQRHRDFEKSGNGKNHWISPKSEISQISRASEHRLEQVLRATDLLLESGGFGLIVLDLADLPVHAARRIPLTTWFRFRRAVENKPTILLAIEQHPIAGSCSSLVLQLSAAKRQQNTAHGVSRGLSTRNDQAPKERKKNCGHNFASVLPTHVELFSGLEINGELLRSRLDRKPARSITFETKTAWAG